MAVNDSQQFGHLLEGIEMITHLISRYAIFEDLYLNQNTSTSVQLEQALIRPYTLVLRYLSKAKKFYSLNVLSEFIYSIYAKDYD
jgi:hypothetical protein